MRCGDIAAVLSIIVCVMRAISYTYIKYIRVQSYRFVWVGIETDLFIYQFIMQESLLT